MSEATSDVNETDSLTPKTKQETPTAASSSQAGSKPVTPQLAHTDETSATEPPQKSAAAARQESKLKQISKADVSVKSVHVKPIKKKKSYLTTANSDDEELLSSINPSYRELKIPYHLMCQQRISSFADRAQRSLQRELKYHQDCLPYALSGVRLHRMFLSGYQVPELFDDPLTVPERIRTEGIIDSRYS